MYGLRLVHGRGCALMLRMALVTLVVVALTSSAAFAVRPARPAERAAIKAAIRSSPMTRVVPPSAYRIRRVRISTVDRRFGAARIVGVERWVQDANALVRRRRGRWRLVDLSNGGGCKAPAAVRADLGLPCY
jgi:hypothetical protein